MNLAGDNHTEAYAYLRDLEAGVERDAPSGVAQGSVGYGAGGPVWLDDFRSKRPPAPSELVDAYKSVAFACVNINANAVARTPLRLYASTSKGQARPRFWKTRQLPRREAHRLIRRMEAGPVTRSMVPDTDDIQEIVGDHPLQKVLCSPNPYFDGNALIQLLARSLDVIGTAYWFPERVGPDWAPTEIWPLHSQYCYPVRGVDRTIIDHYLYFADQFAFGDLIRFRMMSLRDPYLSGYAPLHACFEQLGLVGYYTGVVESMLKGGAKPDAILGPKDPNQPWSAEERRRIEVDVNSRFGRGKQGRIWTIDGSFDLKMLSYPPADLAGLQISKDARLIAANCFDVPISMLESESSNRAVAHEGATQHQLNAVAPRCEIIAGGLTQQLARPVDDRLFFLFEDPVKRSQLEESKVNVAYVGAKVLTPNEIRAELGYEPREGGDDFPVVENEKLMDKQPGGKGDVGPSGGQDAGETGGNDQ